MDHKVGNTSSRQNNGQLHKTSQLRVVKGGSMEARHEDYVRTVYGSPKTISSGQHPEAMKRFLKSADLPMRNCVL